LPTLTELVALLALTALQYAATWFDLALGALHVHLFFRVPTHKE
jgi:hypothetical protein